MIRGSICLLSSNHVAQNSNLRICGFMVSFPIFHALISFLAKIPFDSVWFKMIQIDSKPLLSGQILPNKSFLKICGQTSQKLVENLTNWVFSESGGNWINFEALWNCWWNSLDLFYLVSQCQFLQNIFENFFWRAESLFLQKHWENSKFKCYTLSI